MFILSLTYKVELSEVDKHIDAHVSFLEKYYASGKFIASGRKVPRTGGVILVHVSSRDELDKIIKEDPFYIEGAADYEAIEFVPTMAAEEFSALKNCI
ncbi:YciI-like protein [Grimontia celer]|uniref:YciI-like protein n=1 Tax=Grimontia celer TaxID=1796497 RepID=A0A128F6A6_9GAMM|nr:YciI family protein [Grimontia celer]CZF81826.1 YciI-like protein [Grimontia celer]